MLRVFRDSKLLIGEEARNVDLVPNNLLSFFPRLKSGRQK